jgi:hypothetical protein
LAAKLYHVVIACPRVVWCGKKICFRRSASGIQAARFNRHPISNFPEPGQQSPLHQDDGGNREMIFDPGASVPVSLRSNLTQTRNRAVAICMSDYSVGG